MLFVDDHHSPTDKDVCLIAVEHTYLHRPVTKAVFVQQLDGTIDGGPGGLVVMEQVTTQEQHVHIILLG